MTKEQAEKLREYIDYRIQFAVEGKEPECYDRSSYGNGLRSGWVNCADLAWQRFLDVLDSGEEIGEPIEPAR